MESSKIYIIALFLPLFFLSCAKRVEEKVEMAPSDTLVITSVKEPETTAVVSEEKAEVKMEEEVRFRIQIGAYTSKDRAEKMASEARTETDEEVIVRYISPHYKVRVGRCKSRKEAEDLRDRLRILGYPNAFIVEIR